MPLLLGGDEGGVNHSYEWFRDRDSVYRARGPYHHILGTHYNLCRHKYRKCMYFLYNLLHQSHHT